MPSREARVPPWGIQVGIDDFAPLPGKAEQELQTALQQAKWNSLCPKSRLWLLHAFGIHHSCWQEFTPRCQVWVLRELALLLAQDLELEVPQGPPGSHLADIETKTAMERRHDLQKAIMQTRLPRLVRADPQRAADLAIVCNEHLRLSSTVVGRLGSELEALTQKAAISLPRVNSTESNESTKSRPGRPMPHVRQVHHSSSDSRLRKSPKLAIKPLPSPIVTEIGPNAYDATGGVVMRMPSRNTSRTESKENQLTLRPRSAEAAVESQVLVRPSLKVPPKNRSNAPRLWVNSEEIQIPETPGCAPTRVLRSSLSILPMKSSAWRMLRDEEERQRLACLPLSLTLERLLFRRSRLRNMPCAIIEIDVPKTNLYTGVFSKMATAYDLQIDCVATLDAESEEGATKRGIYEVRILADSSLYCVYEAFEDALSKFKEWNIKIKWPLELVQANVALLFPEYDFTIAQLSELAERAAGVYSLYFKAWDKIRLAELKELEKVLLIEPQARFEGDLLLALRQGGFGRFHLREEPPRQDVDDLDTIMEDALIAQREFKQILAPGEKWSLLDLNSPDVPRDDPIRQVQIMRGSAHVVPGGLCIDNGILTRQLVERNAALQTRPYDASPPLFEQVDVARVMVSCESLEILRQCITSVASKLDLVYVENRFRNPSVVGIHDIRVGVRLVLKESLADQAAVSEPIDEIAVVGNDESSDRGEEDAVAASEASIGIEDCKEVEAAKVVNSTIPGRNHVAQLRFVHANLHTIEHGEASIYLDSMSKRLRDFGVKDEHCGAILETTLEALGCTHGSRRRCAAKELDRVCKHLQRLLPQLPKLGHDLAVEVARTAKAIALDAGVPLAFCERLEGMVFMTDEEVVAEGALLKEQALKMVREHS